ncbi:hypothetical protein BJ165DRAFT_1419877 [Panaeolus papilionaceus]|nr:hypothetical protein BJ165DRAFT_1419877 [Panaeolus papilionaceus]
MILSITRIYPAWGTLRRYARAVAVSFATLYVGLMCWLFTTSCSKVSDDASATEGSFLHCNYERYGLTMTGLTADLFACAFLVISPIVIMWRIPANHGQNILLYTYLGSNIVVTLAATVACIFAYSGTISGPGRPLLNGMLNQIEAVFSIIAANTLVFVTFIRRHDHSPEAIDDTILWKKPVAQQPSRVSSATTSLIRGVTKEKNNRPQTAETQASNASFPASEWYPQQTFAPKTYSNRTVTFVA